MGDRLKSQILRALNILDPWFKLLLDLMVSIFEEVLSKKNLN